jgi:subtilisin family serine protease
MKRTLTCLLLTFLCFSSLSLGHPAPPGKLSQPLWRAYQSARDNDEFLVWIYFTDKGRHPGAQYEAVRQSLTPKSRQRRLTVRAPANLVDFADLPLDASYVATVKPHVGQLRHSSKWLNAVSAWATKRQIDRIRTFEFIQAIDLVARFGRRRPEPIEWPSAREPTDGQMMVPQEDLAFDYGPSLAQLEQIDVPAVHNLGDYGQGVVIGVFDTGFNTDHEAFRTMKIIAAHDFVSSDDDVSVDRTPGVHGHGTSVLSVIGGFAQGQLIGPAFGSEYILARTENVDSETPLEEDNWIAALEWAEGLGVDVISSSVGYLGFDPPYDSFTWQNMDGQTVPITRAAVMAVKRGLVIVNAAGNAGLNFAHNTLMAPADGDGVIAAAAVDLNGARASFSSVGPTVDGRIKPDLAALGVNVELATHTDPHRYRQNNGTSFACPLIAGTAALILSVHPGWSPAQVFDALRRTASNAAHPNNQVGWGIVDALAAVQFSSQPAAISSQE